MAPNRFLCTYCDAVDGICSSDHCGTTSDEESSTYQSENSNAILQLYDGHLVLLHVP